MPKSPIQNTAKKKKQELGKRIDYFLVLKGSEHVP